MLENFCLVGQSITPANVVFVICTTAKITDAAKIKKWDVGLFRAKHF